MAGVEDGEESLDADYENANDALDAVLAEIEELKTAEREAVRERDALTARRDALQLGLNRKDGSASLLSAEGILGPLAELVAIEPGFEAAIAAALGSASDALVAANTGDALAAIASLKEGDATVRHCYWPTEPPGVLKPVLRWRFRPAAAGQPTS